MFLEKTFDVLVFLGQDGIYRQIGDARRWTSHTGGTQPHPSSNCAEVASGGCGPPLDLSSWIPGSSGGFWTFSAMHRHNKQKLALGIGLIG